LPRLIVTARAVRDLDRSRLFLHNVNPDAARRAVQSIRRQLALLQAAPDFGRPFEPNSALRELIIHFGNGGYIALYRHHPEDDAVYVLAFRHQREAGYG
jgi:plasmid stabilization system protein ParE